MATRSQTTRPQKKATEQVALTLDRGELDNTLGFMLRAAWGRVKQYTDANAGFADQGVNMLHYAALVLIERNPECRIFDLSRALGISQTNIVPFVEFLVKNGWISRDFSATDRRTKRLAVTESGRVFLTTLHQSHQPVNDYFAAKLGAEDHRKMIEILGRLLSGDTENGQTA